MPTRTVGRPRLDDGRRTRTTGVRVSDQTFDRFRDMVGASDEGLSVAQVLGRLVERYVDEHGSPVTAAGATAEDRRD